MQAETDIAVGSDGLELTEIEWLLDHHKTKEAERHQLVEDLGLRQGDAVLDLGCGPGLWTALLAEKVRPHGRVIGIDLSEKLLAHAKAELRHEPLKDLIEYRHADFSKIPLEDESVDLAFCGNCFSYVADPLKFLEEQKRVVKRGGRIAVKDFDGANIIVNPIDPNLTLTVLLAATRALTEPLTDHAFDHIAGRKLHGFLRNSGLQDVVTKTYAIQKVAPLSEEARRYVIVNGEWYARMAQPYLSAADHQQWRAHFDPASDTFVLDRPEFYFCMIEVLTIGSL